jgi:hypothetical protein
VAPMKECPFCKAEIPDEAVKCLHCSEWVDGRPRSTAAARPEQTINIRYQQTEFQKTAFKSVLIVMIVLGAGSLIVFLIFLFAFFLPMWNRVGGGP